MKKIISDMTSASIESNTEVIILSYDIKLPW